MEYFTRKKMPRVPGKCGSSGASMCSACSSHPPNFAPITNSSLLVLITPPPPHYTADEMNKSRRKCESLWVYFRSCRSKMKQGHMQSINTLSPISDLR